jgi:Zn-dependent protease with chaperone function
VEAEGRFFDGRSALERAVRASLSDDGLAIHDDAGEVETWSYAFIRRERRGGGVSTLQRTDATARLAVADPAFLDELRARCPRLDRFSGGRKRAVAIAVAALAVVALAVGAVEVLPTIGARLLPVAWEERLGDQVVDVAGFLFSGERAQWCEAAAGQGAIDALVARLTGGLDTPYRLKVRVLESKSVNAFAVPGGRVVVLSGLIGAAASPEELAGVLAHEIGHVVHRHPAEGMLRQMSEGRLLSFATGNAAGGGAITAIADTMIGASYSRSAESAADATGLDLLGRARISPSGFADFFDRIVAKGDDSKGSILASHPADSARARLARERAAGLGELRPAMTAAEWNAVKGMCPAPKAPEKPQPPPRAAPA